MRQLTLVVAALVCLAVEPSGQSPQAADPIAALLGRIEAAALAGTPERYLDLLSTLADRPAATAFLRTVATPGLTRVVVRERDRVNLAGTLPGEGYRLLVEVLRESGAQASVSTWRLDVRRRSADAADWGIMSQEVLTTLQGIHRLSLNTRRQFVARDLVVSAEDLKLSVPEASVFMAETESGPTAYVILGRGEMTFSPAPRGERSQLRVVTGSEALQTPFEGLFVRVHPSTARAHVSAREMIERPVDPRDLKRAEEIFRQDSVKSFGLDLGDLSTESWSLLPLPDDLLAEIRTRRFDTLTYARSSDDVEDISLFDRRLRRNMSIYASRDHLARFSRSYYDDEGAQYSRPVVRCQHHLQSESAPTRGTGAPGDRNDGPVDQHDEDPAGRFARREVDRLARARPPSVGARPQAELVCRQPAVHRDEGIQTSPDRDVRGHARAAGDRPRGPLDVRPVAGAKGTRGTGGPGRRELPLQQPQLLVSPGHGARLCAGQNRRDRPRAVERGRERRIPGGNPPAWPRASRQPASPVLFRRQTAGQVSLVLVSRLSEARSEKSR